MRQATRNTHCSAARFGIRQGAGDPTGGAAYVLEVGTMAYDVGMFSRVRWAPEFARGDGGCGTVTALRPFNGEDCADVTWDKEEFGVKLRSRNVPVSALVPYYCRPPIDVAWVRDADGWHKLQNSVRCF